MRAQEDQSDTTEIDGDDSMLTPDWTWRWAWKAFARWASLDLADVELTGRQRWEVVCHVLGPKARHHYVLPIRDWLHLHLLTWIVMRRLRHMGGQWYRIPSIPVALHTWRRLGYQVREHELVKIDRRSHCCEFWLVDEIGMADPRPQEIERAWHAYAAARQQEGVGTDRPS